MAALSKTPAHSGGNNAIVGGVSSQLANAPIDPSGKSKGNVFGIDGAVAGSAVTVGNLPLFNADGNSQASTVLDAVTAFSHLTDPNEIARIQRSLYLSGAYKGTTRPDYGRLTQDDIDAFKATAATAARTGSDLGEMLQTGAQHGQLAGVAAAVAAQQAQATTSVIHLDNPQTLAHAIEAEFQKTIGRKPTAAETAGFVSAFNAASQGAQQHQIAQEAAAKQAAKSTQADLSPQLLDALNPAQRSPFAPAANNADMHDDPTGTVKDLNAQQQTYNEPTVDQFMGALQDQESGGNSFAVNATTGATGKFQIMPGNWAGWAKEAGLGAGAPMTPGNQEIVARHKLQQYHDQYGSWGAAAAAWYGGAGGANAYVRGDSSYLNKPQKGGPSIADYVKQVTARLGQSTAGQGAFSYSSPVLPAAPGATDQTIVVTNAPNAGDAAIDYARKTHPLEAGAKDVANTFDTFTQLLQGRAR